MQETLKNLCKAFIGESMARNRYTIYSKVAKKEGFEQIAEIFLITADNELEHASWLFKLIKQLKENSKEDLNKILVESEVPTVYGNTEENLEAAIAGENWEYTTMYPEFADMAEKEGFKDIAARLRSIAKAETHHEERYLKILKEVKDETVFKKEEETEWVCRECGYVHKGKTPPEKCPSCNHAKAFYQVKCETY